jgi:tellurite resistance protein TehA-like permease
LTGEVAHLGLPRTYSTAFAAFGVVYGVPVWGFAALWAGLATALTVRAGRHQLPFGLTWWSFTFPVGTCVTGTSGLALHTGADAFRWAAVALYLALVAAWTVVSVGTARGAWRGRLFLPRPEKGLFLHELHTRRRARRHRDRRVSAPAPFTHWAGR